MLHFFRHSQKYKGFTLIEVVAALFIFAIMMVAISQTFSSAFTAYRNVRAVEKDAENAQYFINILAKELRTSTIVSPSVTGSSQFVQFYDYSQGKCFRYRINGGALQVAHAPVTGADPVGSCDDINFSDSDFTTISTGVISGSFYVIPSVVQTTPGSGKAGRVTISLNISEGSTHHVLIQTSVSLRDFGYIGI